MNEILIPALAFGTILAVLWFGVMGVRGVKKDKREGDVSALATRDDESDTTMLTPSAVEDDHPTSRPLRGDAPVGGMAARVEQAHRAAPADDRPDAR